MNDGINKNKIIFLSLLLACLGMIFALFTDKSSSAYIFQSVDNYGISSILNTLDTNYNYVVFLNPFLCMFIGALSHVLTKADVFGLFCGALCFVSLWYMAAFILCKKKSISAKIGAFSIWFIAVCSNICSENYNIITSFAAMSALLPLMDMMREGKINKKYVLISSVLFLFAYSMRFNIVLFFLPFVLLRIFFACKRNIAKNTLRIAVLAFLPVIVLGILTYASAFLYNHSSEELPAYEYNKARTLVQDYPLDIYAVSEEGAAKNITENDLRLLSLFMILDTERIDTEYLQTVADMAVKRFDISNIKRAAGSFRTPVTQCLWIGMAAIAVMFISLLVFGNKMQQEESLLAVLGLFLIIIGFLYIGRMTDSVLMALEYVCACELITIFDITPSKRKKIVVCAAFTAVCVCAAVKYFTVFFGRPSAPVFTARANEEVIDDIFAPTYKDDSLYIWTTFDYSFRLVPLLQEKGKLPTPQLAQHNIAAGGWAFGSAKQKEYFESIGVTNPAYDLLYRPNTYLVADESSGTVVYKYILEHIEPNAKAEYVGDILGVSAWRFIPGE